jgi:hypothetical protein
MRPHIPAAHVLISEYQFRLLEGSASIVAIDREGRTMIKPEISVRSGEYLWFAVSLLVLVALKSAEPLF